ncbi:MAG: DUF1743 domain-containing protein [Candidatus Thermoplasmatota archaeon]|nr:DUF1743 domain-containing protein [Candidatus Thermoplasmatota archaeon]
MTKQGYELIGHPRLVRLNPNIPWKTRGNGAISLHIEGENHDKIQSFIEEILKTYAQVDDPQTNPGYVIAESQLPFNTYEKTVREIATLEETKQLLDSLGAKYKGYKNGRGLIGATASIAWRPLYDKTYEYIAYREPTRWGTLRQVDDTSVQHMDKTVLSTFDNYDYTHNHNRVVPNSPCPVLYGIRGDVAEDLPTAASLVNSEPVESWILFETNQGTDDHVQQTSISGIHPHQSVITTGIVNTIPHAIEGGHILFSLIDETEKIDCAAYEPTKEFRHVIKQLLPGDLIEAYGGVREHPITVNLEKINVLELSNHVEKVENPVCPQCKKHMKSKGKGQGYKCKHCGTTSNEPVVEEKRRSIQQGFYEVPVCARRHLSKPLKRMKP